MKKRLIAIVCILLCLMLTGCNNEYAKIEYASLEKIASSGDRYSKNNSLFNLVDGGYRLTVSRFDGRETLWTEDLEKSDTIQLEVLLMLNHGQVKLVHVDEAGNVVTLRECTPETFSEDYESVTVAMPNGRNKLKVVGYNCENLICEFVFLVDE